MYFSTLFIAALSTSLVCAMPPKNGWGPSKSGDYYTLGCPTNTTKPYASQQEQLAAFTTYYNELFGGKVAVAFDSWVAKDFINHAPEVTGDGTAIAKAAVTGLLSQSKEEIYNIFVGKSSNGTSYAHVYFKGINARGVGAIMEYWRMAGTCLVEHWNVAEETKGPFPNPKAFW